MKITVADLERARQLAGQRLHLEAERQKLACGAPLSFANAKVVFQPIGATKKPPITVEIEEHKKGDISRAILACVQANIDERIAALDMELMGLGIEIEEAA